MRARLYNKAELEKGWDIDIREIDLKRFKLNPVMLYKHHKGWDDPAKVIGKWTDIRASGDNLYATPVFDAKDDHAKEIARKYKEDIIIGVSVGGKWDEGTGTYEVHEASIVDIPLSKSSLKLNASADFKKSIKHSWKDENRYVFMQIRENENPEPITTINMSSEKETKQASLPIDETTPSTPETGTEEKVASTPDIEKLVADKVAERLAEIEAKSAETEKEASVETTDPDALTDKVDKLASHLEEIEKKAKADELKVKENEARALFEKAKEAKFPGIDANAEFTSSFFNSYLNSKEFLVASINDHISKQPEGFQPNRELYESVKNARFGDEGGFEDVDKVMDDFLLATNSNTTSHLGLHASADSSFEDIAQKTIQRLRRSSEPFLNVIKEGQYKLLTQKPFVPSHYKEATANFLQKSAEIEQTRNLNQHNTK